MPSPLISVVMPVFNARRYVAEAVGSILAQTASDFEFIIVNDGSSDGSAELLARLADADSRIRLHSQPNAGTTRALNVGIGLARGELVARMDADDIALPIRFEKQVAYLAANPACVAVGAGMLLIDENGAPLCEAHWHRSHECIDQALMEGRYDGGIPHPTAMIRRETLVQVNGYRSKFPVAQDKDLWLRLAEVGKLANLGEVLLKYRLHGSSTGALKSAEQEAMVRSAVIDACARRGLPVPRQIGPARPTWVHSGDGEGRIALAAIGGGNYRTARAHSLAYILRRPVSWDSWKVAALVTVAPAVRWLKGTAKSRP